MEEIGRTHATKKSMNIGPAKARASMFELRRVGEWGVGITFERQVSLARDRDGISVYK